MGNGFTIVAVPGLKSDRSIEQKWSTKIVDLPPVEKVGVIVSMLDAVVNGIHCGINQTPDYIHLTCSTEQSTELCELLRQEPELKGLEITVTDRTTNHYDSGYSYGGRWDSESVHGIEIRLPAKPKPEPELEPVQYIQIGSNAVATDNCVIVGSSYEPEPEIGFTFAV